PQSHTQKPKPSIKPPYRVRAARLCRPLTLDRYMTIRDKVRRQKASRHPLRALYFSILRNAAFAVAAAGLLGVAATAQAPQTPAGAAKAPVKMAASHVRSGPDVSGPSIEAQNKLVAQYCSGCHSERGKAGGLVLAGFDAAR